MKDILQISVKENDTTMFIDMPSATSNRTTKRSAIIDDDV
jgi:hypothetical protein